ncbi:MAG: hypothetical protein ACJAVZ_003556 [Afipia broomeae]|uniref:hypothetical protein n=1 Tax=Qipengyuania profunda TaxID=3113984 RepID=UPI002A18BE60|nr:hypothetical protein [Qipengyuania sp. HL-TH1]WPL57895.1 hypothetical protein SD421_05535 [Qipengyuania sp. HL-TH5]
MTAFKKPDERETFSTVVSSKRLNIVAPPIQKRHSTARRSQSGFGKVNEKPAYWVDATALVLDHHCVPIPGDSAHAGGGQIHAEVRGVSLHLLGIRKKIEHHYYSLFTSPSPDNDDKQNKREKTIRVNENVSNKI